MDSLESIDDKAPLGEIMDDLFFNVMELAGFEVTEKVTHRSEDVINILGSEVDDEGKRVWLTSNLGVTKEEAGALVESSESAVKYLRAPDLIAPAREQLVVECEQLVATLDEMVCELIGSKKAEVSPVPDLVPEDWA